MAVRRSGHVLACFPRSSSTSLAPTATVPAVLPPPRRLPGPCHSSLRTLGLDVPTALAFAATWKDVGPASPRRTTDRRLSPTPHARPIRTDDDGEGITARRAMSSVFPGSDARIDFDASTWTVWSPTALHLLFLYTRPLHTHSYPPIAYAHNYGGGEIEDAIKSKTFALLPTRGWPDEFAWSGGFYVTPDRGNAEAYGASFLTRCVPRGGVMIMKLDFDPKELKHKSPSSQFKPLHTSATGVKTFAALSPEQIAVIRKDTSSPNHVPSASWVLYDQFKKYDVIVGAVPMHEGQQEAMDIAVKMGMPPIKAPFIQFVETNIS
ncbi:hypothetical protein B0H15DRAFT_943832 [Mycena belliarum]|uniref:Uncharacterized protein n=1 Tax=Mycena belliarum TaxID=1033014 RepID=A0AAD6XYH0_9AGAR|nr:hypothetical protein B0H15DRAFT_943832 [Mycena belliae]